MTGGVGTLVGVLADLDRLVSGNVRRILLTAAILAAVVGVRLVVGRLKRRDEELSSKRRLALSTTVAGTTAVGVLSLLVVWERSGALVDAFQSAAIADQLSNVVLAVILLASAYAITDFLGGVIRELSVESTAISEHQEEMLRRIVQLSVYTLVVLVTIGLFTDNVGSLLVGAGFLGIVVGMAARQTLGAVLAGFVLMFSRPFEVGDWVSIGEFEGTVTEISIINTRLRSFDGEVVTLPNDEVRAGAVVDRSRRNRLRIEIEVGVDYTTELDRAAGVIEEAVSGLDGVARMPQPDVVTKRFADSAVVFGVRYWITNPSMRKRWRTQTAVMAAIKTELEAEGITIPFPQQTLSSRTEGADAELNARIGGGVEGEPTPSGETDGSEGS
ncbi:Small-conductance mechanosensitive channel [Halorubrum aquaticum]|uniref:Small-conductance mechanosensitive channel n=1 Tax=Halorubrum aquaticum TaxID=387340 RepID=A0A1I3C9N6_9EURY|nr:mechanosensitive ion channel family protein [Halorubrum aquaticum]SFH71187.1 Small-conductance mechanosensitive channel [Halorubrum aquaticum]